MRIPKMLNIAGRKVAIEFNDKLMNEVEAYGQANYRKSKIILAKQAGQDILASQNYEISFLHEVVHWIFYILKESELRDNEKLVSQMSELLYQIILQLEK